MKTQIIEMLTNGSTYKEIIQELGCSKATISYHYQQLCKQGILKPNKYSIACKGKLKYNWKEINNWYHENPSRNYLDIVKQFGCCKASITKATERGEFTPKSQIKYTFDEIFSVHKKFPGNTTLKRYYLNYLDTNQIERKCVKCNLGTEWNNRPIMHHLDHIDGNVLNNQLENLRLLCPNCHSQTDTFYGRNLGKSNRY